MPIANKKFAVVMIAGLYLIFGGKKNTQELPVETILAVETRGGLCDYGGCYARTEIREDGSYSYKNGKGVQSNGNLPIKDVEELKKLIMDADFPAIKAKKFSGTCPTAYDGQETTYIFYAAKQSIPTCTYNVDYSEPLFETMDNLMSVVYSGL